MKKLFACILAAMLLAGCTVGPKEEPHGTLITPDPSVPDNTIPAVTAPVPEASDPDPMGTINDVFVTEPAVSDDVDIPEPAVEEEDDELEDDDDIVVDDSFAGTMYSTISLNVRSGPSTDYPSIGHLNEGEAAEVIAMAVDYGWYVIEYNGGVGYVSGSYMVDDDPHPGRDTEPDTDNQQENDDGPVMPERLGIDVRKCYEVYDTFVRQSGYFPTSVALEGYYGEYPAGTAVAMSVIVDYYSNDEVQIETIGDCYFERKPIAEFYIYTPNGRFILLRDAYESGLISDEELKTISYYVATADPGPVVNGYEDGDMGDDYIPGDDDDVYPQLDPLDHAAKASISADYDKANSLPDGTAFVVEYYGEYNGCHAVVMWKCEEGTGVPLPVTDDVNEFTVLGRPFTLSSGSYSIRIHTPDGQFLTIKTAIDRKLITERDLDMISYYNMKKYR